MSETWMPGIERAETAAKGGYGIVDGAMQPTATVHHVMEGYLSTMRLWAAERPAHHQASYHFGLGLDGSVVQFVPIFTAAWHSGRLDKTPPTWPGWKDGTSPNAHTVSIAAEGFWNRSNTWNDAQVESAISVQRWINEQTGIESSPATVIGHCEIAPTSRANDPGPNWPKDSIIEKSAAAGEAAPPPELTRAELINSFRDLLVPNMPGRFKTKWVRQRKVDGGEEHTLLVTRRRRTK
jgi:N-acetyl-anhydromuramyl-L-alanine amidase AmpD